MIKAEKEENDRVVVSRETSTLSGLECVYGNNRVIMEQNKSFSGKLQLREKIGSRTAVKDVAVKI